MQPISTLENHTNINFSIWFIQSQAKWLLNKGNFDHLNRTQQKPGNILFTEAFSLSTPTELRILQHSPECLEYRTNKDDVNASSILVKKKKRLDSWRHKWNIMIASYAYKSNNVNTCVNVNYIQSVFNFLIEVFCIYCSPEGLSENTWI